MKLSDGLFLKCCQEVAAQFPEIIYAEHIVDNTCMQLVMNPTQYDVILTENLYGDILSDLCSGLIGGLGLVPGANLGKDCAIFEAVHGSAPDIAGKDKANPTALIQSAVLMLAYIDEPDCRRQSSIRTGKGLCRRQNPHRRRRRNLRNQGLRRSKPLCRVELADETRREDIAMDTRQRHYSPYDSQWRLVRDELARPYAMLRKNGGLR